MKTILLFLIAINSLLTFAQKNLVINGGFEKNTDGWWADNLQQNNMMHKVGAGSCMIAQYVGKEWKGADQKINIPKGTFAIAFSAYLKGDAIEGGENYGAGIVNAEFLNGADKQMVSENIAQVKGTTDWKLYSKLVLVPEGAKKIKLLIALQSTPGVVFFDEIKAIAISEEEYYKKISEQDSSSKNNIASPQAQLKSFENTGFENGLENWNGIAKIITTDPKTGSAAVALTATVAAWTAIDQTADVPLGTKAIEVSGWLKALAIEQGVNSWNNGQFIIEFTSDGKTKTSDDQLIGTLTASSDWTYFKRDILLPIGTKKVRIMVALSYCTGTLIADDIQIKWDNEKN